MWEASHMCEPSWPNGKAENMASKVRIEFISAGFKQCLQQSQGIVTAKVDAVAAAAGDGFNARVIQGGFGGGRPVGFVSADTAKARKAEAKDKVLSKALNAARG